MKKVFILTLLFPLGIFTCTFAQDIFENERVGWLQKAEALKPVLMETVKYPVGIVKMVEDPKAFQGWKAVGIGPMDSLYQTPFKQKSGVVVDFGEHLTGYFSCQVKPLKNTPDAPLRFRFTFGEVPAEVETPFDPYPGGLSRAWLQDETITVMELPATIIIPRRLSFRYVKIELLGSSPYFEFHLDSLELTAVTSATTEPPALPDNIDPLISEIDRVGLSTLKECMQTVYEDGPKRDQRLWIGDLYLEALANNYSFQNHDLTKRCLYLLAGLAKDNGYLNANVFETPEPHPQEGAPFLFDYSLLYNVALKDYVEFTKDMETGKDLWPLAKKQLENPGKYMDANGVFDNVAAAKDGWWLFVEWNNELDKQASIQGIIIFALKETYELAKILGKENEVKELPGQIDKLTKAAKKQFYNKKTGLFESGPDRQVSYATQAWMVLSGVASQKEGQKAFKALFASEDKVYPGGPYMYHYVVEAMLKTGLEKEARETLVNYWGDMVKKGADTFWEVYDPKDEKLSPYNFFPVNSYCHAWSCTPVYFIRKYPKVFQVVGD